MYSNADFSLESAVASGEISFKPIPTFFDYPFERTDSSSKPASKRRRKRDGGESTASDKSRRVRFRLPPLYRFLICNRIPLRIARASR